MLAEGGSDFFSMPEAEKQGIENFVNAWAEVKVEVNKKVDDYVLEEIET